MYTYFYIYRLHHRKTCVTLFPVSVQVPTRDPDPALESGAVQAVEIPGN